MSSQRFIQNKGKTYLVNVPSLDEGVGAGFAVGQLVMKSGTDSYWYVTSASGSAPNAIPYVSESKLTYYGTSSYYDINYPYQLLGCADGNTYQLFLTGSAPNAGLVVSQSIYATGSNYAKPYLILQSITDNNYYTFGLTASAGVISLVGGTTMISQSWIHPIY